MAKKLEKLDYTKLLEKMEKTTSPYFFQTKVLAKIENQMVTDDDINEICNCYECHGAVVDIFCEILEHHHQFDLKRPQFQKFSNKIINKFLISKNGHDPVYVLNSRFHEVFVSKFRSDKSCFDYDENGVDILPSLYKFQNILSNFDDCVTAAYRFKELINMIRQQQLKNITSKILSNDIDKNKQLIENTFGNLNVADLNGNSLLNISLLCDFPNEKLYNLIINLLEVGVDPNLKNNKGYDFLETIISYKYYEKFTSEYFIDILKKAIQFGYNSDSKTRLFVTAANNSYKQLDKIYEMICEESFDIFEHEYFEVLSFKLNLLGNYELADSIKFRRVVKILLKELEQNNYALEESFYNKMLDIEKEILPIYKSISCNLSDEELVNLWGSKIIENRSNSVELINEDITVVEILNGLRLVVNHFYDTFNQTYDKCVIKLKNK